MPKLAQSILRSSIIIFAFLIFFLIPLLPQYQQPVDAATDLCSFQITDTNLSTNESLVVKIKNSTGMRDQFTITIGQAREGRNYVPDDTKSIWIDNNEEKDEPWAQSDMDLPDAIRNF